VLFRSCQPAAQGAVQFRRRARQLQAIRGCGHLGPARQVGFAHAQRLRQGRRSVATAPAAPLVDGFHAAYTGRMPVTHYMALLLALLVLALAGVVLAGHRRREREQREHLRDMREREGKLRLSLWASNEFYWQYDLERRELESLRI